MSPEEILLQAAEDIRAEELCQFDMENFGILLGMDGSDPTPCNTAGCIAGVIVARQAPEKWRSFLRADGDAASPDEVACRLLGFDDDRAWALFMGRWPGAYGKPLQFVSKRAAAAACEAIADGRMVFDAGHGRWISRPC